MATVNRENHAGTPRLSIEWGVAGRPITGEVESGDLYLVRILPAGALIAAVDGLGHGPDAALAARTAVAALDAHAGEPLLALLARCHERLRGTRGVVMTLASLSAQDGTLAWLGVGNVEGLLVRRTPIAGRSREYVVQRGGVVGEHLPPVQPAVIPVMDGDCLILATDGIGHAFAAGLDLSGSPRQIADRILAAHGKSNDDALVLVVRFVGHGQ